MLTSAEVTDRLTEVGWVPDYLDDLDADFRAFYGVQDMLALPGARFFALAERTFAYGGVMSARAEALQAAGRQEEPATHAAPTPVGSGQGAPDATDLARDSRFSGIFSVTRVVNGRA